MDLETAQTTTTVKLPILKQGEYDMWRLRIEQYFQVQDYALWDVIENENSFKPVAQTTTNADCSSTLLLPGPVTTEEKASEDCKSAGYLGNKPDLDTISFDDFYNNFKIVEQEVKGTTSSSSSSQNMAFVSSLSSTNEVNTAYGVSTANTQVSPDSTQDLEQIHEDDIEEMDLKWQLALLSMRTRRWDTLQGNAEDLRTKIARTEIKTTLEGLYMADDEVPTNIALMAFSDSENEVIFYEQLAVLKRDISYKDSELSMLKSELEKFKQEKENNQLKIENFDNASKSLDKLIRSQITDKSRKGVGFVRCNAVPPPYTGLFLPLNLDLSYSSLEEFQQPEFKGYGHKPNDKLEKKTVSPTIAKIEFVRPKQQEKPIRTPTDCNYHQREMVVSGNNYTRVNYNYSPKKTHPSAHRNMVPRAVLMKTGLRSLNTTRPVNTTHPKTIVYSARSMSHFSKSAQSTGHPQKEDQGYVDSGCLRHMTWNMSYLSAFKEFDGGYVTFGGGAKGGKITGKGTLKTGKLDFKDVYFVKELQFNLLSVSQMCDKKNSVLFTDTGCFVLSHDFKLADES
ncbi:hypothetical protein Tco_0004673 [Tanacetum coccineum]